MKSFKIIIILNSVYLIFSLFLFLDLSEGFDIKSEIIKEIVYYGFIIQTILVTALNLIFVNKRINKILLSIYPILFVIYIIIFNSMYVFLSINTWKTQEILYQNIFNEDNKIEEQMLDLGAFGYIKRQVEVHYITPYFIFVNNEYDEFDSNSKWEEVFIKKNELNLKNP